MASGKKLINPLWFLVPDFLWMMVAVYIALAIKYGQSLTSDLTTLHYRVFLPLFLFWLLILFVHNLFDPKHLRRYTMLFFGFVSSALIIILATIVYFYAQPDLILTPRRFLVVTVGIWFGLALSWHLVMKFVLQKRIIEGFILFAPNNELDDLHKEILRHDYLGFRSIGYLNNVEQLRDLSGPANLIVAERTLKNSEHAKIIYELRQKGVNIFNQIDFYEVLLRRVPLDHIDESWFLRNIWTSMSRVEQFIRRVADIAAGIVFALVFLVTFPFIAVAIKIESRGSLLFIQPRVGFGGKSFMVYKYRTMNSDSSGRGWTKINDPRITKVGKFLRRTHLDELPQWVNLLTGTMSVVGPRPEQIEIVEELKRSLPFYNERHAVNPGLTGWAQLNIYAGSLEESKLKLEYDLYYLKHRSPILDLEIILKTLYAIIVNKIS